MRGTGSDLGLAALPIDQLDQALVQLVNENACWEGRFIRASTASAEFNAKGLLTGRRAKDLDTQ